MAILDEYRWSVAFLLKEKTRKAGIEHKEAVGTGFFVRFTENVEVPGRPSARVRFLYFVTAAHVVKEGKPKFLRVSTRAHMDAPGTVALTEDIGLLPDRWVRHEDPGVDVAAISVSPGLLDSSQHQPVWGEPAAETDRPVDLGERVYYVGLLGHAEKMVDRNIPMVRSGTLGAWRQEGIPFRLSQTNFKIVAHLIDCHAFSGFSGSPVFAYRESMRIRMQAQRSADPSLRAPRTTKPVPTTREEIKLLGMLIGHFPTTAKVFCVDDPDEPTPWRVPINSGVGIVVPAEFIWQTLAHEKLAEDRRARLELAREILESGESDSPYGPGVPD